MTTAAICATREVSWLPSFYRGEQYDSDLGLYYLRARYYNPATGRFMSRDSEDGITHEPRTLHKYLYAGGDPVNIVDPTGRMLDYTTLSFKILTAAVAVTLVAVPTIEMLECIAEAVASAVPHSKPSIGPAHAGRCAIQHHDEWPYNIPKGNPLGTPHFEEVWE
jgi:RHS repeat-associated protein